MGLRYLAPTATLLFIAASAVSLRAQFQNPTPAELKMTSDPMAPGAAAVYLDREETTSLSTQATTYYARVKVLTEKGKELASVHVPFLSSESKVDRVEGRTIHPDGTIVPLIAKPDDLVELKGKNFQLDSAVFTLPGVEVGSILEYTWRVKYKGEGSHLPSWELQTGYFIHKEHFSYNLGSLSLWLKDRIKGIATPPTAPVTFVYKNNEFTVDLADVPAAPDDDWMPPTNTLRWRAEFFSADASSADGFWKSAAPTWKYEIELFIAPTATIKKAAEALIAEGDTDEQKARKLYAAAMKLDNTDFSRVKSEAERKKDKLKRIEGIDDVWKNQAGTGDQIALLYVALARAAGLKAWPMWVVDRSRAIFNIAYLDTSQFDDYIAIVDLGGTELYLDPGQKGCPFGVLQWTHALTAGMRESPAGSMIARTPSLTYKQNAASYIADVHLDGDGNMQGSARIVLNGSDALYWRQKALQNDPEEIKKQFIEALQADMPEGTKAEFDHFVGLDDYDSNLMAIVSLSGSIGTPTGKRMILPGLLFETRAQHPFVAQDKRVTPIDVHYPRLKTGDVVYHLPPGYTVESAPQTADVTWPGNALLRIKSAASGDTLEVGRVFARNFTLLGPENYQNLHDFYLKLAAADQQQIVLLRPPTLKGN